MRPPKDPVWLARQLEGCYRLRDALAEIQAEQKAAGGPTIEEMVAAVDVRQTVETWLAYYHRELRLLARSGGHGHRVQGAHAGRGAQQGPEAVRARPAYSSQEITR